jgi:DNA uptake protein ComE-like DNA-binding protein
MMDRATHPLATNLLHRRSLVTAVLGAGLALGLGQRLTFAQTPAAQVADAAPENAAAWPMFNLNSATTAQFQAVPGAGDRMTREFEEYRPYTSIGQFRGEIGKYVSPEDVGAFEAYLFVPVDPDQADADTLQQLPGVTADVANTLISGRPYASAQAFLEALGKLAPAELATAAGTFLAPDAGPVATWLRYNLNTASNAQFQGIPGAGERMSREFEEYRPYTSIAQFRGEIGKYVSPEEVAGFERYLFVPAGPDASDPDTLQQLPGVTPEVAKALQAQGPFDSPEALKAAVLAALPAELATYATGYLAS